MLVVKREADGSAVKRVNIEFEDSGPFYYIHELSGEGVDYPVHVQDAIKKQMDLDPYFENGVGEIYNRKMAKDNKFFERHGCFIGTVEDQGFFRREEEEEDYTLQAHEVEEYEQAKKLTVKERTQEGRFMFGINDIIYPGKEAKCEMSVVTDEAIKLDTADENEIVNDGNDRFIYTDAELENIMSTFGPRQDFEMEV